MNEVTIIPGINETDFEEVRRKVHAAEAFAPSIHIDIEDGKFLKRTTFSKTDHLFKIKSLTPLELHLMVNDPESYLPKDSSLVKKIIVHVECEGFSSRLLETLKPRGFQVCLAVMLGTDTSEIEQYLKYADSVQLMTIELGPKGQKLRDGSLPKIESFKKTHPEIPIQIDGGVNPQTVKRLADAGASFLVSVSYVFTDYKVEENIKRLKEAIHGNY